MQFAFAAQCALGWWLGYPHPPSWGCECPQRVEIHCTQLSGGEPCAKLLALQGKTTICPQVMGLQRKNTKSRIAEYMGNYRETSVKMKELAQKEVLKKHEDLQLVGETLGWKRQQPLNYV